MTLSPDFQALYFSDNNFSKFLFLKLICCGNIKQRSRVWEYFNEKSIGCVYHQSPIWLIHMIHIWFSNISNVERY